MGFLNFLSCSKHLYRNLGNGRYLEYIKMGNGVTKTRIFMNESHGVKNYELINRIVKVNKEKGERLISQICFAHPQTQGRFFDHRKINNIYDEAGNFLKRNILTEHGVLDVTCPGAKSKFCSSSNFWLTTQRADGTVNTVKCARPDFKYVNSLEAEPSIFHKI